MELEEKIFVAGHNGLVGSAVVRKLKEYNYDYLDPHLSWHYHLYTGFSQKFKNVKILEIGTYLGEFTRFLSNIFPGSKIITCDLKLDDMKNFWPTYDRQSEKKFEVFIDKRNQNLNRDNIKFLELDSLNLLDKFPRNEFDLIWIDGDHLNPQVSFDIFQSIRLLKQNSLMCCDDIMKKKYKKGAISNESFQTLEFFNKKRVLENSYLVKRMATDYKVKKYICISKKV